MPARMAPGAAHPHINVLQTVVCAQFEGAL